MSDSCLFDLDNELNRNDETLNDVDFEEGGFLALKPNFNWREHAHHNNVLIRIYNFLRGYVFHHTKTPFMRSLEHTIVRLT